jgi:hypothetical protein
VPDLIPGGVRVFVLTGVVVVPAHRLPGCPSTHPPTPTTPCC